MSVNMCDAAIILETYNTHRFFFWWPQIRLLLSPMSTDPLTVENRVDVQYGDYLQPCNDCRYMTSNV